MKWKKTHPHRGTFVGLTLWTAQCLETERVCRRAFNSANCNWNWTSTSFLSAWFPSVFDSTSLIWTQLSHCVMVLFKDPWTWIAFVCRLEGLVNNLRNLKALEYGVQVSCMESGGRWEEKERERETGFGPRDREFTLHFSYIFLVHRHIQLCYFSSPKEFSLSIKKALLQNYNVESSSTHTQTPPYGNTSHIQHIHIAHMQQLRRMFTSYRRSWWAFSLCSSYFWKNPASLPNPPHHCTSDLPWIPVEEKERKSNKLLPMIDWIMIPMIESKVMSKHCTLFLFEQMVAVCWPCMFWQQKESDVFTIPCKWRGMTWLSDKSKQLA